MVDTPAAKEEATKVGDSKKQEASYCSTLGDGLCVPEQNEQIVKQNLHQEADK